MKKINLSADRYLSLKARDLAPSQIIIGPFGNKSSNAPDFYVHANGSRETILTLILTRPIKGTATGTGVLSSLGAFSIRVCLG